MKFYKNNKGITLIALIVTIIVMIILIGVTISVSINGGLFNYAKTGSSETQIAKDQEIITQAKMMAMFETKSEAMGKNAIENALDNLVGSDGYTSELTEDGLKITFVDSGNSYIIEYEDNLKPNYFYIYHTSNCTVERVVLTDVNSRGFDITAKVDTSQYLYGGYYSAFGGSTTDVTTLEYTNNIATDTEGKFYDPSKPFASGLKSWWKNANALTTSGKNFTPVNNTVYYLKEVPKTYLTARLIHIFETSTNRLLNIHMFTIFDDKNYTKGNQIVENGTSKDTYYGISITNSANDGISGPSAGSYSFNFTDGSSSSVTPSTFDCRLGSVIHVLADLPKTDNYINPDTEFNITPYWITLDGVTVYGTPKTFNTGHDENNYCTPSTLHEVTN